MGKKQMPKASSLDFDNPVVEGFDVETGSSKKQAKQASRQGQAKKPGPAANAGGIRDAAAVRRLHRLRDRLAHRITHGPIPLEWVAELEPLIGKIKEQETAACEDEGVVALQAHERLLQKICYLAFSVLAPVGALVCYVGRRAAEIMGPTDDALASAVILCGLAIVVLGGAGIYATKRESTRWLYLVLGGVVALYMVIIAVGVGAWLLAHEMSAPFRTIVESAFRTPAKRITVWRSDVCLTLSSAACSDNFLHFPTFSSVSSASMERLFGNCTTAYDFFASSQTADAAQTLCRACVEDCRSEVAHQLGGVAKPVVYAAWCTVAFMLATLVFNFLFLLMAQSGPSLEDTELFEKMPELQKRMKAISSNAGVPFLKNPLTSDHVKEGEVHGIFRQYQELMKIFQRTINSHVYVEIPWLVKKVGRALHLTLAFAGMILSAVAVGSQTFIDHQCSKTIDCDAMAEIEFITAAISHLFYVGGVLLLTGLLMYHLIMKQSGRDLQWGKGMEQTTEMFIRITSAGGFVMVFVVLSAAVALTIGLSDVLEQPSTGSSYWPALRERYQELDDDISAEFRCKPSDSDAECLGKMQRQVRSLMGEVDVYFVGLGCGLCVWVWAIVALVLAVQRVKLEDEENWHPLDWCFVSCIDGHGPGGTGNMQPTTPRAFEME